jgi:hypothetical protein
MRALPYFGAFLRGASGSYAAILRIVGIFVWAPFETGGNGGLCKVSVAVTLVTRPVPLAYSIFFLVRHAS